MWLTKNEKKVLKLLIDNAKLSDTSIANKLNISSQAIGRIRKKLEEDIIKGYTVELDLKKLGLNTVSLIELNIPRELIKSIEDIEKKLIDSPESTSIFKLSRGFCTYWVTRICDNLEECEELKKHSSLEISKIDSIPLSRMIKRNIKPLLHKTIDKLGTKTTKIRFGLEK